jgi:hypothetical protein
MLIIFTTTHDVILAERLCRKAKLPLDVVPVPKDISSDCGMALEIDLQYKDIVTKILDENSISVKDIIQ